MRTIDLTPDSYAEWDAFCRTSDEAWFWHTSGWIEYAQAYRPEWHPISRSFFVKDDNAVVAICPLLKECVPSPSGSGVVKEFSLSYGGGFSGPAPALANNLTQHRRDAVLREVMSYVDYLAEQEGVVRVTFRLFPLTPAYGHGAAHYTVFPRHGFLDVSLSTQVISLNRDIRDLWREVRKGHRYDVRRGAKTAEMVALDHGVITDADFSAYFEMHHRAAGRVTRPQRTFELQYRWIQEGNAILFGAKDGGQWLAFAFLLLNKGGAYYQSGCQDPNVDSAVPIGHALQWHAIEWLKSRGFTLYEIGWQFFSSQPHFPVSEKEIKISTFKRMFGGQTVPIFSGEKYYSRDYYLHVAGTRTQAFAASLQSKPAMPSAARQILGQGSES